jgi:hypothetical protein
MVEFKDNDKGYFEWLKKNPNGYVVNTERTPSKKYLILHKSNCNTISKLSKKSYHFTKDYIKFCSNNIHELNDWAKKNFDSNLHFCKICF